MTAEYEAKLDVLHFMSHGQREMRNQEHTLALLINFLCELSELEEGTMSLNTGNRHVHFIRHHSPLGWI